MRTNVKTVQAPARTHEGAPSFTPLAGAVEQLRRALMSCMLFEDEFYETGKGIAARIAELVKSVGFKEAAQAAIDAREKMKLRHAPLLVVRELVRRSGAGRAIGDLIFNVVQRADELAEFLAIYWKEKATAPLTAQMKVGLARALKKFKDYELAKYDRENAVQLRDVAFLCHVRSNGKKKGQRIARLVNRTFYPAQTKSAHFPVKETYGLGEYQALSAPDTWEVALSSGADKKETFTRLLLDNKLGALALLRNLRNMIQAGVDENIMRTALVTMKVDRVLPFRFISAARHAPRLEDALEQALFRCVAAMPKLAGPTCILIDHSRSMEQKVSAKSEVSRFDAAGAVAMLARELCDRCRVFTFSDRCLEIPPRRGFAMFQAIKEVINPQWTLLGSAVKYVYQQFPECRRIIVVTDEQSADQPPHPRGRGYIINVGSNANGIGYGPWVTINGWSEAIFEFMRVYEDEVAASPVGIAQA